MTLLCFRYHTSVYLAQGIHTQIVRLKLLTWAICASVGPFKLLPMLLNVSVIKDVSAQTPSSQAKPNKEPFSVFSFFKCSSCPLRVL